MNIHKSFLLFLLLLTYVSYLVADDGKKKLLNYIVTFKATNDFDTSVNPDSRYKSVLSSVTDDDPESRHIYSYNKVTNGFAAKLSKDEAKALKDHPGCARIIPAHEPLRLMTTHTPHFLGLSGSNGLWRRTKNMGEGIIIGVLDSGIAPGHASFGGDGMPPPPAKWKGHCDFNGTTCNNKLIGAKSMLKAGADEEKPLPPIDTSAHGTHTASIAAGNFVDSINVLGVPMGNASGVAPRAHIAAYKVCNGPTTYCQAADILKGFEEAIDDGCDVISISLGDPKKEKFKLYEDVIAMASFSAILKGVLVSACAGNEGPQPKTNGNGAPWLLSTAASTTDRQIRSTVKLGNGLQLFGQSLYQPTNWTKGLYPLIYMAGDGPKTNGSLCLNGTLDKNLVHGKIVVCELGIVLPIIKGQVVKEAGGVGMIVLNDEKGLWDTEAYPYVLPASFISYADTMKLKNYIRSTKQPMATFLFEGPVYHENFSPSIPSFSSRGPSLYTPLIAKPDIAGPGVAILAAIPPDMSPSRIVGQDKSKSFYYMSGTSMSTPLLSGIAAIIKKAHPDWSPSAIKSAVMTTAYITDIDGKPIVDHTHHPATIFDMGAGHVDPNKALDPGLVYDNEIKDYISYLCGMGFADEDVNNIISPAPPVQCAKVESISEEQLNYPSIAVPLSKNISSITIYRTVTNVGKTPKTTYKATISVPKGIVVKVQPSTLKFNNLKEKKTFKMVFERQGRPVGAKIPFSFGELKWVSGRYSVRSPIVFFN